MPPAPADLPPIYREPQYRHLWSLGMSVGLIRWIEVLAYAVFAYEKTQSALWVASLMMLRMLPMALLGLWLGVLAARLPRRKILLTVHGAMFAVTLVLLLLSLLGRVEVWHLVVASGLSGVLWACDMPVRRGLMGDIAGPARMAQAMSFDQGAGSVCRLIGPGLGGFLLAGGGLSGVFVCLSLLYVPALLSLWKLREPVVGGPAQAKKSLRKQLGSGFEAARASPLLRAALWLTILFNLFAWPVLSMVPVIAQERLQLDPQGVGLLVSLEGVGALVGALLIGMGAAPWRHGPMFLAAVLSFLTLQLLLAWSPQLLLTAAALLVLGAAQTGFGVMQSTLVYTSTQASQRAQAMGVMTMCIGASPLGFLLVGALAERLGAPWAISVCAVSGLLAVALTWRLCRTCLREPTALAGPVRG
jgi:predicted MFS family arabinose efflux permease